MKLEKFNLKLIYATHSLLVNVFYNVASMPSSSFKNYNKVEKLIARGESAIEKSNHNELLSISNEIWGEIIDNERVIEKIKGTGLGS